MLKVGFMQGRLSPMVDGQIQAFPWDHWEDEFKRAHEINISLMEWTLDQVNLHKNPYMTKVGQKKISELSNKYNVRIKSLTGDCFMQEPFWKAKGARRTSLLNDFDSIICASSELGVNIIVIPLVDNGRIMLDSEEKCLYQELTDRLSFFENKKVKLAFESDFTPQRLKHFIDRYDTRFFGVNYDIGNSASLGYDVDEEIDNYGHRIINVHIKDRLLGGTTVPLGSGNANFEKFFSRLSKLGYSGNFILQTARAEQGSDVTCIALYLDLACQWIKKYAI